MISQENKDLIKKHLEDIGELEKLSVEYFLKYNKVSGSLLIRLDKMLNDKAKCTGI